MAERRGKPVTERRAREIAHSVVGEHTEHPLPQGHKGLPAIGTMEAIIKRAKAKLASRGK